MNVDKSTTYKEMIKQHQSTAKTSPGASLPPDVLNNDVLGVEVLFSDTVSGFQSGENTGVSITIRSSQNQHRNISISSNSGDFYR